jgi:cobaltochelatase CobT
LAEETPSISSAPFLPAPRVVSDDPEVDVAWTADAPSQSGAHFRLPMPGRSLPAAQVAEARGFADAMALRLRHHDPVLHQRGAPNEAVARACYDAVEQVRYEALGSDGYAGMRDNLDAALATRMASDPIARAAKPDDVPLQAAVALLLRERLTGQPIPASAQLGTSMVRSWIEQRVGGDFDALAAALEDQKAFQHLALDMLQHLELTQAANPDQPETEEDEGEDQENDREDEQDNSKATPKASRSRRRARRPRATRKPIPSRKSKAPRTRPTPTWPTRARKACCRRARTGRGPTCPMISTTRPSPPSMTRWSPRRTCATRRN